MFESHTNIHLQYMSIVVGMCSSFHIESIAQYFSNFNFFIPNMNNLKNPLFVYTSFALYFCTLYSVF